MNDLETLRRSLRQCVRWNHQLVAGIERFLEAEHAGEMGNRDKAVEHLEHLMEHR